MQVRAADFRTNNNIKTTIQVQALNRQFLMPHLIMWAHQYLSQTCIACLSPSLHAQSPRLHVGYKCPTSIMLLVTTIQTLGLGPKQTVRTPPTLYIYIYLFSLGREWVKPLVSPPRPGWNPVPGRYTWTHERLISMQHCELPRTSVNRCSYKIDQPTTMKKMLSEEQLRRE